MPLNEALEIADEIKVIRNRINDYKAELDDLTERRAVLQQMISAAQTELAQKRIALKAAAADA